MNLFTRLRDLLLPRAPRSMRNKRGGLAYIRPYGQDYGADAISGHIVTTVRPTADGMWFIEPRPSYVLTADTGYHGRILPAGLEVWAVAIPDEYLEPIRPVADSEQCESLAFFPKVPALKEVEKA